MGWLDSADWNCVVVVSVLLQGLQTPLFGSSCHALTKFRPFAGQISRLG